MNMIYTIGFTKKNAETFFGLIKSANVSTLIDVRLNNVSQLAGFAKRDDLKYFLKILCDAEYVHVPKLAPTKEILNAYKKKEISWEKYEDKFSNLMAQRHIERLVEPEILNNSCLLCSEHEPIHCHRRLVAEYLSKNSDVELKIKHLY
ncbi:DUF488 family protein [Desulfobacula sp.]|uniref:DUF488 domain-containing protein n=1 Tax=Desulfobacula sp. TaxID=2593537 RepID=UPI00263264F9|nr:DUF488 domain-containing protein [Desulfobacula sp.]